MTFDQVSADANPLVSAGLQDRLLSDVVAGLKPRGFTCYGTMTDGESRVRGVLVEFHDEQATALIYSSINPDQAAEEWTTLLGETFRDMSLVYRTEGTAVWAFDLEHPVGASALELYDDIAAGRSQAKFVSLWEAVESATSSE